ncbi:MAG: hypothetical protein JSS93_06605 [Bacteroidetes bacterium]|nr:hypothetical protein [Bacteroidota bacterium]
MIERILFNGLLTTVIHLILYVVFLYGGWSMGKLIHAPKEITIIELESFGIEIILSFWLFAILLFVANIISAVINKNQWTYSLLAVAALLYALGWSEDFNSWPWQTALFIIAGVITIFFKFFIDRKINHIMSLLLKSSK